MILVLEFIWWGFKFFLDEMVVLGWVDYFVYLFFWSFWICRGVLEMVGFLGLVSRVIEWMDKLFLDIEEIKFGSLGEVVFICYIIIL